MLAAAESDLEPHFVGRHWKQRRERFGSMLAQSKRETRQQCLDQPGLMRTEPMTLAATEKEPCLRCFRNLPDHPCCRRIFARRDGFQETLPRIAPTRSVFSHEKPPSFSGCRPKCPYAAVRA